jgi:hypothetical protein
MLIFVLTATYELRVSRKSHLRDHPRRYGKNPSDRNITLGHLLSEKTKKHFRCKPIILDINRT